MLPPTQCCLSCWEVTQYNTTSMTTSSLIMQPDRRQVYNTGRSLGQFVSLLTEKAGKLALPDVLITAVGTKVLLCWLSARSGAHCRITSKL